MIRRAGAFNILMRCILALVYGVPILWIAITSLKSNADIFKTQGTLLFTPTVAAYREVFNTALLSALRQSAIIAFGATAITLVVAVSAGYALARMNGIVATVGLGALIVLQMVPQTATVIPLFQVLGEWHLLDGVLGVILSDAALLTPFAIMIMRPFFRAVPIALEEAAAIDGASAFRVFRSVALPIARNGIATIATLVFLLSWGEFLYSINFFLSPGKYPLSALLVQQVSAFGINWPNLMALAVTTSIPVLLVFSATYRLLREGLTVGAVK